MYIFSLRIHPIYQISIKATVTYNVVNIILYNFLRMDLVQLYTTVKIRKFILFVSHKWPIIFLSISF